MRFMHTQVQRWYEAATECRHVAIAKHSSFDEIELGACGTRCDVCRREVNINAIILGFEAGV
jgi:hypothetical protein